jgi:hypothetical protein
VNSSGEKQLLDAILDGQLYLVAEYRAGLATKREFVDKVTGKAKEKVSARHMIEVTGSAGIDSVTLFQGVPETETDPANVKMEWQKGMPWQKGKRYAFPLVTLGREKGKTSGLLDTNRGVIPL